MPSKKIIVIDVAHGDQMGDRGASQLSGRICEADIVLAIGLEVRDRLKSFGYEVIMTRETSRARLKCYSEALGDLPARVKLSNDNNADIYVSLHVNSHYSREPNGLEVFNCPGSVNGKKLATNILNEILKIMKGNGKSLNNRGVKESNFYVLTKTDAYAILIETAFLSNQRDRELLASKEGKSLFAKGIINGILNYFEALEQEEKNGKK